MTVRDEYRSWVVGTHDSDGEESTVEPPRLRFVKSSVLILESGILSVKLLTREGTHVGKLLT